MRAVTRWEARLFARALAIAVVALALGWLLSAATDEGGLAFGERAGRTLPLLPICTAVAVWASLAPVRGRGEARALEAIGETPRRIAAPAVAGASLLAWTAAAVLLACPGVSTAGFYPTAARSVPWAWDGRGFVAPDLALRVDADGVPTRVSESRDAARAPRADARAGTRRAAASLALGVTGMASALWVAARTSTQRRRSAGARWAGGGAFALAALGIAIALVSFQAAAVRSVSPWLADVPLALLLLAAAVVYRRSAAATFSRGRDTFGG